MIDRRAFGLATAGLLAAPQSAFTEPARIARLSSPRGRLSAYIAPSDGGELVGLGWRTGEDEVELLYRGRDLSPAADWRGKAPILWPAVGRNFGGGTGGALGWTHGGLFRPMPIHGFAKDLPWRRVAAGPADLTVRLQDTPLTRQSYPFGFVVDLRYALRGERIELRHRVLALQDNAQPMPFSIGNHVTFRLPLLPGGDTAHATIATPARRQVITDAAGRPTGEVRDVDFRQPRPVASLPPRTAVSLSGYSPDETWAELTEPGLSVRISHRADRWPRGEPVLFNLWGDAAAGFFSPEPWVGKQNSLVTGDGLIRLAPGQAFSWTVTIAVTAGTG